MLCGKLGRRNLQHRSLLSAWLPRRDITELGSRTKKNDSQPESWELIRPYLAVLVTFGNVYGPISGPEAAVQNSPRIADRWEYQPVIKGEQEDCVHSTKPLDLVLGSANAVEFKPSGQCSSCDTYVIHRKEVHFVVETVLMIFSAMMRDGFEVFLIGRDRPWVA